MMAQIPGRNLPFHYCTINRIMIVNYFRVIVRVNICPVLELNSIF